MIERVKKLLSRDYSLYSDMLDCIARNECKVLLAANDVVVMQQTAADLYYLAPFSAKGLTDALELLKPLERRAIVLHGEAYFDEFFKLTGATHHVPCYQATFPIRQSTEGLRRDVEIRPLGEEWTDFVTRHYSRSGGHSEYCRERLASGKMFGAFVGDEIAGFIGQHDENSIGLLEVLPAFSGKGIGKTLEVFMINRIHDQGYVPFCHVIESEKKAYAFHMKREGVIMSADKLTWTF